MTQFTTRTTSPFRYDIVGSFLRPQKLRKLVWFCQGKINQEQLTEVENQCITELVNKEEAAVLNAVTDGEFRRSYWHLDTFWGFAELSIQLRNTVTFSTTKKPVRTLHRLLVRFPSSQVILMLKHLNSWKVLRMVKTSLLGKVFQHRLNSMPN